MSAAHQEIIEPRWRRLAMLVETEVKVEPEPEVEAEPEPATEPEVEVAPTSAVPDVVTVIPPQSLPEQTATALDAGRLNWRTRKSRRCSPSGRSSGNSP